MLPHCPAFISARLTGSLRHHGGSGLPLRGGGAPPGITCMQARGGGGKAGLSLLNILIVFFAVSLRRSLITYSLTGAMKPCSGTGATGSRSAGVTTVQKRWKKIIFFARGARNEKAGVH